MFRSRLFRPTINLIVDCLSIQNYSDVKKSFIPAVLVHGGAGDISDDVLPAKVAGVKKAARIGYQTLMATGCVLDAVQKAVMSMEEDPNFNAGLGSVLTWDGQVEMDAGIMDGASLEAGCVSMVKDIQNPIVLARYVMENSCHRYIVGEGVMSFAKEMGFEFLPPGSLITERSKNDLHEFKRNIVNNKNMKGTIFGSPGTVGCVAIDECGNLATATSTGGLTGKMPGRIGDSPILGAGTYADNDVGCVSTTGHGESILSYNVASKILAKIHYCNMSAQDATVEVLDGMTKRFNEWAGVISIDHLGNLGIYFTADRMSWAYLRGQELHFGIKKGEDYVERVDEEEKEQCE